jgi:predicted NUDIX family NTP pyrophosphohydrolase
MRLRGKVSAGILLYRRRGSALEVFLAHPGGPFWKARDDGVWTIPKGEVNAGEEPLDGARREFNEETGFVAAGPFVALTPRRQKSGKTVHAWACEGDVDPAHLSSNEFTMEWPPRSGRMQAFPEVDRAAWFTLDAARVKMLEGQRPFLDDLLALTQNQGQTPFF